LGYTKAQQYLTDQLSRIANQEPLVGPFDVNYHGQKDNDIYYKGSWMLHTLRSVIDNDTLWFSMIKELCTTYKKQQISTVQIIDFFSQRSGTKLNRFFEQYLYTNTLPVLEYKIEDRGERNLMVSYRWINAVTGFNMPIKLTATKGVYETVTPTKNWQLIDLNYFNENDFNIEPHKYLINLNKIKTK
jgi:aminopeptidase N